MNEAHRENLSALTDGELEFDQVRFILRRAEHDAELRISWSSYHVARDCLRGEFAGRLARKDFADRVMAALDAPAAVSNGTSRRWLRWSAGGAIAASVAVVALMVARPAGPGEAASGQVQTAAAMQSGESRVAAAPTHAAAPEVPRWLSAGSPAAQLTQPAAASVLDGRIRGDTLIPAAYSRQMAPYMSLRRYPVRPAANARQYGRTADGRWIIPMMPPGTRRAPATSTH
jgi:sigma-E factor negative regulatory protein RseA